MGQSLSCGNVEGQQLLSAIREEDIRYVETLAKEDPKVLNRAMLFRRQTPLHLTASLGHYEVLQLLLKHGATPNVTNNRGQTPLMLACKNGRWVCIDPLLLNNANVLSFDRVNGRTCLHYAASEGHMECVRRILNAAKTGPVASSWGFVRFLNVRDAYGATPLHLAARGGHISVLKHLLQNGALVSATTTTTGNGPGHGSTPLHSAARSGSVECVRELLAWGADRNVRDVMGYSPYGVSMKYKTTACAALLNPNSAEPIVWPSPWKFISELDPEAKLLLEAALAEANYERETASNLDRAVTRTTDAKFEDETAVNRGNAPADLDMDDVQLEKNGSTKQNVCCICFENVCTLEVQECGHQMCASCTLALCCHNKPNPSARVSPPPACPFCRQNITQLVVAKPKLSQSTSKICRSHKITSKDHSEKGSSRKSISKESANAGSFKKILIKETAGTGSFKMVVSRSTSKGSGRIADLEWLNRLEESCWQA